MGWQDDTVIDQGGPWMHDPVISPPSHLAVAGNAAMKGVAGFGDMFLNAPVNAYNVAKAGATLAGVKGLEITPQPNILEKGMTAAGLIRPENEPQTPEQRVIDLAAQTGAGMIGNPLKAVGAIPKAIELGKNLLLGSTAGTAGGLTKEATGSDAAGLVASVAVPLLTHTATNSNANAPTLKNPTLKATLEDAQAAGYVVAPSSVKPSMATNKIESVGGKAAVRQQAARQNVQTTDRLTAEELDLPKHLGLPADTALTPEILTQYQNKVIAPYAKASQLSPLGAKAWERLQNAREEARLSWAEYNGPNRPKAALKEARQWQAKEKMYEGVLDRVARQSGQPELMQQIKEARTLYAKSKTAEEAMNLGNGSISATAFGRMLENGVPLTGNFKIIGKFARAFPDAARDSARIPSAGVSGTDAGMAAMLGTVGYGAAGGPAGMIAAGAPLLRSPARSYLLSNGYQSRLLKAPVPLEHAIARAALAGRPFADQALQPAPQ